MPILTAIDVLGVQRFIFCSNRMRDVVSGSWLVHWSTATDGALRNLVPQQKVLLAGGGNAILEFESMEEAKTFTAKYTRRLYDDAPGLDVAVAHREFHPGELAKALQALQIDLARTKIERIPSATLLGLSVTAACQETRAPAVDFDPKELDEPNKPLSNTILKRRGKKDEAVKRWSEFLQHWPEFVFPMELDDLGRTRGDTSLIGVVHVDGNGVGQKIKQWLADKVKTEAPDEAVRREYQQWSQAINELGERALQAVVDRVCQAIKKKPDQKGNEVFQITGEPQGFGFELKKAKEGDACWLPLRPILLGGDDLTFVCDGRIALDLAETALSIFEKSKVRLLGGNLSACAGVAMVRVHAPFARAYKLAERLCTSAKAMLRTEKLSGCAMDWHIGSSRPSESIAEIRERQYQSNGKELTCRPYRLGPGFDEVKNWRWLSGTLLDDKEVGLRGGQWSKRRNKVKALAEVVREGSEGVRASLESWQVIDERLKLPEPIREDGFSGPRTPLLDALELLDLYLSLNPQPNNKPEGAS
jgi:hypothetical protein